MNINKIVGKTLVATKTIGIISKNEKFYCIASKGDYFYLYNHSYGYELKFHISLLENFSIC